MHVENTPYVTRRILMVRVLILILKHQALKQTLYLPYQAG